MRKICLIKDFCRFTEKIKLNVETERRPSWRHERGSAKKSRRTVFVKSKIRDAEHLFERFRVHAAKMDGVPFLPIRIIFQRGELESLGVHQSGG